VEIGCPERGRVYSEAEVRELVKKYRLAVKGKPPPPGPVNA
jgi:hypothetical protein